MSDEQQRPDVRRLWQSQKEESTPMSLSDIRSGAAKMNRMVLTQAFAAGLAFLIFGGFCGVLLYLRASIADTRTREGLLQATAILLIGAGYSFWKLVASVRRVRGKSLMEEEPSACAAFYRAELERQRNSSRRSAVWVPLAFSAVWAWGFVVVEQFRVIMIVIWVLFVPFWVYHNVESARGSQRELDKLNRAP